MAALKLRNGKSLGYFFRYARKDPEHPFAILLRNLETAEQCALENLEQAQKRKRIGHTQGADFLEGRASGYLSMAGFMAQDLGLASFWYHRTEGGVS